MRENFLEPLKHPAPIPTEAEELVLAKGQAVLDDRIDEGEYEAELTLRLHPYVQFALRGFQSLNSRDSYDSRRLDQLRPGRQEWTENHQINFNETWPATHLYTQPITNSIENRAPKPFDWPIDTYVYQDTGDPREVSEVLFFLLNGDVSLVANRFTATHEGDDAQGASSEWPFTFTKTASIVTIDDEWEIRVDTLPSPTPPLESKLVTSVECGVYLERSSPPTNVAIN